ncbi:LpxL/LpxP family Kdo(2)-lipid IV(A) lauroyl/palmitoleoyl acyltransferase [Vibrio sp. DW001]|uniref:LpxL/LpxP family Kdo(2)-lipid IV(A) lauroyl/palmitoleoyl acyltransferase n=1 Tax=Vibrio sp. DW001 TaxID=2912315 RepID=UPI0023AFCC42|nr:LpxL/LpxP family Kdo(2)-lipid IV(A) lauroyl/palmitoleoyl acyltransferase [Vibrio sp. DW001]WED26838.1 LpxL/LpxP family Kdo(2)-lipid IV(A) lauroyl/palmitoleoyl acyltransferase [Vibrio sp. DW001]
MSRSIKPKFTLSLLHPKYWLVWLGFGFLALFVNILPYKLLYFVGRKIGQVSMKIGKSRVKVARRNLELAFPERTAQENQDFVEENFKNTGLALIETAITWFWPTWRFKRLLNGGDYSEITKFESEKKGILFCCAHALNLEITGRALAVLGIGGFGVYRPHNNPVYNFIQYRGRAHNGNRLIDRKDVKGMIRALRNGDRIFYLPDHDYGRKKSVFVPFFAVDDACTTTGTSILVYTSHCAIVTVSGFRNQNLKYDIQVDPSFHLDYPQRDEKAAAAFMNKHIENIILKAPEQWMWLHKRFKTMEDESIPRGIRYK